MQLVASDCDPRSSMHVPEQARSWARRDSHAVGATMIATIPSAVLLGVDGTHVSVEVHVSNGLPGFTVVGLPDAAVRESRDRVRASLLSSGLP